MNTQHASGRQTGALVNSLPSFLPLNPQVPFLPFHVPGTTSKGQDTALLNIQKNLTWVSKQGQSKTTLLVTLLTTNDS